MICKLSVQMLTLETTVKKQKNNQGLKIAVMVPAVGDCS